MHARNKNSIKRLPKEASWLQFGNSGDPIHFYHANGFTAGTYTPLLERLSENHKVSALNMRPTWAGAGQPPRSRSWMPYADDLIAYLEAEHDKPVIGIGHSMAAIATVYAAEKRPDLFKVIVIIEPAMLTPFQGLVAKALPKALMNFAEPAKSTLVKPDVWPDRESFLTEYKANRAYKSFSEGAFAALADHAVRDRKDGQVELAFPKIWEAHNYSAPPAAMKNLARIQHPCAAVFGKPSLFFSAAMVRQWREKCPNLVVRQDTRFGHLFPIEAPEVCAPLIEDLLSEIL